MPLKTVVGWAICPTALPLALFTLLPPHVIFNTVLPEWRNWQTQQTQNLPGITPRVGSTPSSGTIGFLTHLQTGVPTTPTTTPV